MDRLKISVVMTAYNGEKFVKEQMDSLFNQTRAADEILAFDDKSADSTAKILKGYGEKFPEKIKFFVNEKNVGWKKNFIDGMNRSSGDVIFFADQDDIWMNDKIEKMACVMEENPQIEVLACNFVPLYEKGSAKLDGRTIRNYGKKELAGVKFFYEMCRPGCCMCVRKNLIPMINALWTEDDAHDALVWYMGLFRETLYILNVPLIKYRRHSSNVCKSSAYTHKKNIRREMHEKTKLGFERLLQKSAELGLTDGQKSKVEKVVDYYEKRQRLVENPSLKNISGAIRYLNFYPKLTSFLADLMN
jgi:glycosyltransferase involved in cell wall biosynthesis